MTDVPEIVPGPNTSKKVRMEGPLVLPTLHALGSELIADAMRREEAPTDFDKSMAGLEEPEVNFPDLDQVQNFADTLLWWHGQTSYAAQQIMYEFPEQVAMPLIRDRKNFGEVAGMIGEQLHFQADFMSGMYDLDAVDSVARELQNPEQWLEP